MYSFMNSFMLLSVYTVLFFVTSILYISFKTFLRPKVETFLASSKITSYVNILTLLKAIPLVLAIFFAYFLRSDRSLLYMGIIIGLLFCLLGDYFIDRTFIEGMLMFAIAHIFFIISFLYVIDVHLTSFTLQDFGIMGFITLLIVIYDYFFLKYLRMLNMPDKYITPITGYTLLISLMLASSIWLAYTTTIANIVLLPIGALFFVLSDSLIALREFSSKEINYSVLSIMGSYYIAIFLISLTTLFL